MNTNRKKLLDEEFDDPAEDHGDGFIDLDYVGIQNILDNQFLPELKEGFVEELERRVDARLAEEEDDDDELDVSTLVDGDDGDENDPWDNSDGYED